MIVVANRSGLPEVQGPGDDDAERAPVAGHNRVWYFLPRETLHEIEGHHDGHADVHFQPEDHVDR